jgi:Domain of unknown function (DUF4350)
VRRHAWLIPAALVVVIAGLVLVTPNRPSRSPDHRSESDAVDGTSALYSYASALGHPTSAIKGSFNLPGRGLLFVFSPDTTFTDDQLSQVDSWVSSGGVLIYADNQGDNRLDALLNVARGPLLETRPGGSGTDPALLHLVVATPVLPGVITVIGSDASFDAGVPAPSLVPAPTQAVLLREESSPGGAAAVMARRGEGTVIVLSDPQVLANGNLGKGDNGRLAADLISMSPAGFPVMFDEYHHGAGGTSPSPIDWITTPWGAMLGLALLVVYVGLVLRGRSFGPRVSLAPARDRSSAESAEAVGTLLRRARARATTWGMLDEATRRSLASRVGLSHGCPPDQLAKVLQQRAPELARDLVAAEASADAAAGSERALLEAARLLHSLAYPSPEKR